METTTTTARPTCAECGKTYRWEQYEHKCKGCRLAEDLEHLRKCFPPGSTVHTNLVRVSKSGMSRLISVHTVDPDGEIRNVSGYVAKVIGFSIDRDRMALKVSGCGMDMGYHVAYALSHALYRDDFRCIGKSKEHGKSCPSNDHSNREPYRKGKKHSDGGYALRHRWI